MRIALWIAAAFVLLAPMIAMQVTSEVNWGKADFALFGVMLAVACGACELAATRARSNIYRAAVGVAVAAAFVLIWMNLAVGLIGTEDNPANWMFSGVLAVGIAGAVIARFRPKGMMRALAATALAQVLAALIALIWCLGSDEPSQPGHILVLNGIFTALWCGSALLFRKAALDQEIPGTAG